MSLVGFKAQNHPQQKRNPKVDDRATSPEMFAEMVERYGSFTLDVAASAENTKCERFYSIEDDGLAQPWRGDVWCNPPYSDIKPWVVKAHDEWEWSVDLIGEKRVQSITMLLPANRTEQGWWQDWIEPHRVSGRVTVDFLRHRRRFIAPGADGIGPNERPPFGLCVVRWAHD